MKIGNLEVYGIIYKITNLVNGKVYIGQTIKKNGFKDRYPYSGEGVERVYKLHKYRKENGDDYNNHLLKSIEKYGFDKFKVIETFDYAFSKKELDIKEQLYISLYNSNNDLYGYNRTIGGESFERGGRHYNSKDIYCITFDKIFSSIVEAENYYGNISKCAISAMLRGKQNRVIIDGINTGWCYFEDYKKMTKDEIDLLIYKSTDEYRSEILSKAHIGKYDTSENPNSKKVICLTTGEIFNSAKEAIEKYNCNGLYSCLTKRTKTSGRHPITKKRLEWDYYKK